MRAGVLLFAFCLGCHSEPPASEPMSLRDRLAADPPRLMIAPTSHGAITAQRWASDGWKQQRVDLVITDGDFVAATDAADRVVVRSFAVGFAPIEIPASVIGTSAELTNVRLHLDAAPPSPTTWTDDDDATATTAFDVSLTWSLEVRGSTTPLGPQTLEALPGKLVLASDGETVTGTLAIEAAGDVWTWADLVKLSDLSLALDAATPPPL